MKERIDLDDFKPFVVPENIAKCPKCDYKLWLTEITGWSEEANGTICDLEISVDCETEPDIDDPDWDDWIDWHYDMPYVDWLPIDEKVKRWLLDNFEFVQSGEDRAKLEKWVANVTGQPHDHLPL